MSRWSRALSAAVVVMTSVLPSGCASNRHAAVAPPQPSLGPEVVDQARLLTDAGRQDEAIRLLALAIERNPTLTIARLELGDIYRNTGDYASAETQYGQAAQIEPANFDAQFRHGLVLQLLDRLAEAVRAYLRALAIRPHDAQANLNLATAYMQLDEAPQALGYAERAVEFDPLSGPARANLAAVYSEIGRHEDAVRAYEAASELMDLSPRLLMSMADSLGKIGRFEEMANTLTVVIRMDPNAAAYERLGFAMFRQKQYAKAEDAFTRATLADKTHYPALNGMAVCLLNRYLQSDKQDAESLHKAVELLRDSLRLNKDQPRIVELLSRYS
jgi:tetratricopeptide (TPR) repeat protein